MVLTWEAFGVLIAFIACVAGFIAWFTKREIKSAMDAFKLELMELLNGKYVSKQVWEQHNIIENFRFERLEK